MGFGEWLGSASEWVGNTIADGSEVLGGWAYEGIEFIGLDDEFNNSEIFNRLADIASVQEEQLREGRLLRAAFTGAAGVTEETVRLAWDGITYVAHEANEGIKSAFGIESWGGAATEAFEGAVQWTGEQAKGAVEYLGSAVEDVLPEMPDFSSWQGWATVLGGGFAGLMGSNIIGGGMMTNVLMVGAGIIAAMYIKDKFFSDNEEVVHGDGTDAAGLQNGQTDSVEGVSLDDTNVLTEGPAASAFSGEEITEEPEEELSGDNVTYLHPQADTTAMRLAA